MKTPQQTAIIAARLISQELEIPIPSSLLEKITGIKPATQSRILRSHELHTLHNVEDKGPDPRGRPLAFTKQETSAVADYIKDSEVSAKDKGKSWQEVVVAARIDLPNTTHFKPTRKEPICEQSLIRIFRREEGLGNFVMEEEAALAPSQRKARVDWVERQIILRPKGPKGEEEINWRNVVFSDEYHLSLGPERTMRVKRPIERVWKRKPWNIQKKKVNSKTARDMEKKEDHFRQLHVFVAIGYNYKKLIPYNTGNKNRKMSTKYYTEQVLPALKDDLLRYSLILYQDGDGSHTS